MRDHDAIVIDQFEGMFSREGVEAAPEGHAAFAQNVRFGYRGVRSRTGAEVHTSVPNILRIKSVYISATDYFFLILSTDGKLWDGQFLGTYPTAGYILDLGAGIIKDFSAVTMYGRVYITLHDGTKGLTGQKVYVYDGLGGTARITGAAAPGAGLAAAVGAAGNVEPGDHLYAVVYETATGYITQPSPIIRLTTPAGAGNITNLTTIPTGPAGTIGRYLLATRAIVVGTYNGNPKDYELFYIPVNGHIADNVTVARNVSFFDSDLINSADYLYDNLNGIPAGCCIAEYNGRLCVGGPFDSPYSLYVSKQGEPESISGVDGILTVQPGDPIPGIKNLVSFRGALHIAKTSKSYVTQDTGLPPITWAVERLDAALGTETHGIASIPDMSGTSEECFLMADRSGLLKYTGSFAERALTWKIEDFWRRIAPTDFYNIEVCIDPLEKLIYANIPWSTSLALFAGSTFQNEYDGAPVITDLNKGYLLVGDYSNGLNWQDIKWALWRYPWYVTSIQVVFARFATSKLWFAGDNLYVMDNYPDAAPKHDDKVIAGVNTPTIINSFYDTAFVPDNQEGELNHIGGVGLRAVGSGALEVSLINQGYSPVTLIGTTTLTSGQTTDIFLLANRTSECHAVRIRMQTLDKYFNVSKIRIFSKPIYTGRPL